MRSVGVRLHYVERGEGEPIVLLHGNGSMIQDYESSGLLDKAAEKYRVIVFDRPGYGHSGRPRGTIMVTESPSRPDPRGPARARREAGDRSRTFLGSDRRRRTWAQVRRRREGAGPRLGVLLPDGPGRLCRGVRTSDPILGDILRYTLAPLLGRIAWPALMRKILGPAEVPRKFTKGFPKGLALRPSQLRASAAESALLVAAAIGMRGNYGGLTMPVVIIAGELDRLIDTDRQSERLHRDVGHSTLHLVPGAGHMVHQTAINEVMAATDEAAGVTVRPKARVVPPAA